MSPTLHWPIKVTLMGDQTCSTRIKGNFFSRLVTSAHADVWVCSKCFTDNSNLLDAVIAFNNCCDAVSHTPIHSTQLCICPAAGSGRQEHPRDRPSSTLCPTAFKRSHRIGLSLPFCFSFKGCRTGSSGCRWSKRDLSSALVPLSLCHILKSKWN